MTTVRLPAATTNKQQQKQDKNGNHDNLDHADRDDVDDNEDEDDYDNDSGIGTAAAPMPGAHFILTGQLKLGLNSSALSSMPKADAEKPRCRLREEEKRKAQHGRCTQFNIRARSATPSPYCRCRRPSRRPPEVAT